MVFFQLMIYFNRKFAIFLAVSAEEQFGNVFGYVLKGLCFCGFTR